MTLIPESPMWFVRLCDGIERERAESLIAWLPRLAEGLCPQCGGQLESTTYDDMPMGRCGDEYWNLGMTDLGFPQATWLYMHNADDSFAVIWQDVSPLAVALNEIRAAGS